MLSLFTATDHQHVPLLNFLCITLKPINLYTTLIHLIVTIFSKLIKNNTPVETVKVWQCDAAKQYMDALMWLTLLLHCFLLVCLCLLQRLISASYNLHAFACLCGILGCDAACKKCWQESRQPDEELSARFACPSRQRLAARDCIVACPQCRCAASGAVAGRCPPQLQYVIFPAGVKTLQQRSLISPRSVC
jgi:hypothetical protein